MRVDIKTLLKTATIGLCAGPVMGGAYAKLISRNLSIQTGAEIGFAETVGVIGLVAVPLMFMKINGRQRRVESLEI